MQPDLAIPLLLNGRVVLVHKVRANLEATGIISFRWKSPVIGEYRVALSLTVPTRTPITTWLALLCF